MDQVVPPDAERVVIAEALRTRGIRGEIVARSQTDVPGRLDDLERVHARLADGTDRSLQVERVWQHKGNWVLKFAGIDSIEAAEPLRGADFWVPLSDRGTLPQGHFFRSDLIGCSVINSATGELVGFVKDWLEYGGAPLMEVRVNDRDRLIPFVAHLCHVDLTQRTIRTELPAGILDL